ncbi:MAG: hypothetical protein NTW75_05285 [Planctomycetales bacterium]|nr:hypothetical protein [Planctomycetales bacterium]
MSGRPGDDWIYSGRGVAPTLAWSFSLDTAVVDVRLGRETGEVIAADASGGLYLLDRRGQVLEVNRTRQRLQRVVWCDNGTVGAAVFDDGIVASLDRRLQFRWTREMPADVLSLSIDPYGTHVAVSMEDGFSTVLTSENKKTSRFETVRPLKYLQCLATSAEFLAAADHGLLGRYSLKGDPRWTKSLWSGVGDLAATGDGKHIFLAGFSHGIQCFAGESGASQGTFVTEGTVGLVSCGYFTKHLVAATLERQLIVINDKGNSLWQVTAPEDISRVLMSPLGDWIVCGFASGRIIRLDNNR